MPASTTTVQLHTLSQRKLRILDLLAYKGAFTKELKIQVLTATDVSSLEEFYDSYNSTNETKELTAVKQYLSPLASILWRQEKNVVPQDDALAFIAAAQKINSRDEALAGARDIIAEWIRNNKEAKKELKALLKLHGSLNLEIIQENHPQLAYYKQYINGSILPLAAGMNYPIKILEAEGKGILSLSISLPKEESLCILEKFFIKKDSAASQQVRLALEDSYKRFLLPYLEMEIRTELYANALQETPKKKPKYLFFIPLVLCLLLIFYNLPHSMPNGITTKYYANGQVMSIEGYLNGKRDGGFRKFLPNGQIVLLATYKNGVLDGESREYYGNGEWKTIKNYQDGLLEGFLREYDEQGRLQHQTYYHNNMPLQKQNT